MPDEVTADHSNILVPQREENASAPEAPCVHIITDYTAVSGLLLSRLGLEMPAAKAKLLGEVLVRGRQNEEKRPSRPNLARRITRLRDAAFEISEALASPQLLNRLAVGDPSFLAKWPDCWSNMEELHQAAEAALLTIPKGKGRARSATPEEISARATCALLVAELFELSGRRLTGPNNARAHAIAEALWLASGGPPWTGHAKNLASWIRYFHEMTKASAEYRQALRSFVRARLGTKLQVVQA